MKSKRVKKVVATIIAVLALMILLYITHLVFLYNDYVREATFPLGGVYENIGIMETTRRIPLELVYQFEFDGELPPYFRNSPGFFSNIRVEALNERFGTDFETEDGNGWVLISHRRVIGQLYYDVNWQLHKYIEDWGYIAIPRYERDYSPNTIYVYTSAFPLGNLYSGEWQGYFTGDPRYVDDWLPMDVSVWTKENPSPKYNWWQGFMEFVGFIGHKIVLYEEL